MSRFLIISQPQSGGQMLQGALAAHPDVALQVWNTSQDNPRVFDLLDFQNCRRPYQGVITHAWDKDFIWEVYNLGPNEYWLEVGRRFSKIIILNRKNQLRRYLSYCIAELLNEWGVYVRRQFNPVVDLDFAKFTTFLDNALADWREIELAFPDAMNLSYEDLADDWGQTFSSVLRHLGLRSLPILPDTYRQEHRLVQEIIGNWSPKLSSQFQDYGMGAWLL